MKLDLRLFDGGAGAAGSAGAGTGTEGAAAAVRAENTGAKEGLQDAAGDGAEGDGVAGQESSAEDTRTPEERRQAYRDMINSDEYRDFYHEDVEGIIDRRLRGSREKMANYDQAMELINYLGSRYGITDGNVQNIQKAVEQDDAYWEDAAAREGLSTEQYKRMKKLEAENQTMRAARENTERLAQKEQIFAKWNTEAEELGRLYKGFDLRTEVNNPDFVKLLGAGIPMRTAYETLHHDEIMSGAMEYTARKVAKKQIDAIKAGQSRPAEGAAGSTTAFQATQDINKLSGAQIRDLARRSLEGETITPSKFYER